MINYKKIACVSLTFLTVSSIGQGIGDKYWGFCDGNVAYSDAGFKSRKPEADWVCQAPTALDTGEASQPNTNRCIAGQRRECEIGAGGETSLVGDHNVANSAWYWIPGSSEKYPDIKCQCGCFTEDVNILTTQGYKSIEEMAKTASLIGGYSVATLGDENALTPSERLVNKDFTVGPEDKVVYHIVVDSGSSITLTDSHPVLISDEFGRSMVQARSVTEDSQLVLANGDLTRVEKIETIRLSHDKNLVYNLNTKGSTEAQHVIMANGFQVGDLYWQKKLSEQSSRAQNILKFSQHL